MLKSYTVNENIYKRILLLAIPITIENLIYNFINFIDIFMVGKENPSLGLGAGAISALGVSNQFFFLFTISLFGILSGANVLAAQYYGANEHKNLRKLVGLFLLVSLVYVTPFFLGGSFFTNKVLSFYTNDLEIIKLGNQYLKIVIWTFPIAAIGSVFSMLLRAINLPKFTLYASIIGLIINITLNLILIPEYGVVGAAIATVIARIFTLIFLIIILIIKKIKLIPKLSEFLEIDIKFLKSCIDVSMYTFFHEILWSMAISIKAAFFGRTGLDEFSSIQIALNINGLLFTTFIGVTAATAVIVGNELGNDEKEKAMNYAQKIVKLYTMMLFIIIFLLNLLAPFILRRMGVNDEIYGLTRQIIYAMSITSSLVAYTMLFLVGIFRAGGDVKFSMLVEILPLWFVSLPVTYFFSIVYPIPIALLYLISYIDEFIKLIPCLIRFKSKKWINKII